jgi:hypothetical protein
MTRRLREIFLVKCQKQAFSFNKREEKVYCYAFLHVLKTDTRIKHEQIFSFFFSFMRAGGARVPARYAKMPWLEPGQAQSIQL